MYKLALIVLSSLSFCQEVPEFLNDSFPKHEYHESSNVSNPALKTVEPQNTQMNQKVENAPTPSPIENSKNTQLKDISSEDRYAPQKLWAQAITEYALSFDYINHKQHFYLMRPFFDQNGWHELSALIREKFADIDAKKQISKAISTGVLNWTGHDDQQSFSVHKGTMPLAISFFPENKKEYIIIDLSIKCNMMKKCLIHSLSARNDTLQ